MNLKNIRETGQLELPVSKVKNPASYDIYPVHNIGDNLIQEGYESLAEALQGSKCIKLDGYIGILIEEVKEQLQAAFDKLNLHPQWINVAEALKAEEEIDALIAPFLGGDDPVFGNVSTLRLKDFFIAEKLNALAENKPAQPVIFYGTGAQLVPREGETLYFDISKNEIQFRSRAGALVNLGAGKPDAPKKMYKRFYFVDWPVLNRHKNEIRNEITYLVDGQRTQAITWVTGEHWSASTVQLSRNPIRVRPWFEPGAWGGQWIKKTIPGLPQDVVNYAWSFELIVPENGVILESSGVLLEYSFDFLMYHAGKEILGTDFKTFGHEFPIRFDFLDTFDGGNLSIQCHPQKQYMQEHFGEQITQEETYYILDSKEGSQVYLGFQEGVKPEEFQQILETSVSQQKEVDITDFVQVFPSKKHDLYLIPPGTIHSAGKNNLVLEISATPYIYTFKMYDWMRLGMDGKPRPINIERGMENLVFERSGDKVKEELISRPKVLEENENWELQHLPTHSEHLYDIQRYKIVTSVEVKTNGKAHVLSLVEGQEVVIETADGSTRFYYAESFIIPAATKNYTIKNPAEYPILVLKAFIKY